ncbi:helix-turn-helix domain-containing protein [Clostridioides difficile]|uniref:helix-turn-helix domain-containing protein n=1 Tax=Clostridioides difficile TaxID=1496 RepID=UPI0009800B83|nr:helix-turn-helix transcriptional regulator [Clostridioides difficile]AXU76140.1 transcriptional regulator [Clostridioides difficile]SJP09402.1 HTH-type transcriptional regulator sinR [Clostridioides difficile]HBF4255500.1 helix-turn-helix transcriptional regulator [Clostridioides difficile]HDO9120707.1 helix-turn-helix transcriptional regulator [Clostridioides difficile]HDO9646413.1 helix-turn-helix transcriptional regulator [Clostridioides difficile]
MDVTQRIIELRDKKGYSTNKLATKAGLTQSTLQSILSGRNQASINTIEKICSALDISLSDFFNEKSNVDLPDYLLDFIESSKNLSKEQLQALSIFLKTLEKD